MHGSRMWEVLQSQLQLQIPHGDPRRQEGVSLSVSTRWVYQEVRPKDGLAAPSSKRSYEGKEPQMRLLWPVVRPQRHIAQVSYHSTLAIGRTGRLIGTVGTWRTVARSVLISAQWISGQKTRATQRPRNDSIRGRTVMETEQRSQAAHRLSQGNPRCQQCPSPVGSGSCLTE